MELPRDYKPEFDSLRKLLLEIATERSVELLLRKVVKCLAERPHALLARIWLTDASDICGSCDNRPDCRDQQRCLHLVASAQSPEAKFLDSSALIENGIAFPSTGAWSGALRRLGARS